jgi:hypothetical protein
VRIGELRLKLDGDFRADFVAAAANRRANGGEHVAGLRAELHLHSTEGFYNDALERPAPSSMNGGNRALFRIDKKNRDAVRGLDSQKQGWTMGRGGITATRLCRRRLDHLNDIRMDLFQCHKLQVVRAECRLKAAAIFKNVFPAIPFRKTKVQNFSAVQLADASEPRAEAMDEPRKIGECRNLQDPDSLVGAFDPGALASNGRALLASAAFSRECFRRSHNSNSIIGVERVAERVNGEAS